MTERDILTAVSLILLAALFIVTVSWVVDWCWIGEGDDHIYEATD